MFTSPSLITLSLLFWLRGKLNLHRGKKKHVHKSCGCLYSDVVSCLCCYVHASPDSGMLEYSWVILYLIIIKLVCCLYSALKFTHLSPFCSRTLRNVHTAESFFLHLFIYYVMMLPSHHVTTFKLSVHLLCACFVAGQHVVVRVCVCMCALCTRAWKHVPSTFDRASHSGIFFSSFGWLRRLKFTTVKLIQLFKNPTSMSRNGIYVIHKKASMMWSSVWRKHDIFLP